MVGPGHQLMIFQWSHISESEHPSSQTNIHLNPCPGLLIYYLGLPWSWILITDHWFPSSEPIIWNNPGPPTLKKKFESWWIHFSILKIIFKIHYKVKIKWPACFSIRYDIDALNSFQAPMLIIENLDSQMWEKRFNISINMIPPMCPSFYYQCNIVYLIFYCGEFLWKIIITLFDLFSHNAGYKNIER